MARIKVGDIFEIDTPKGKAYLHYIHKDPVTVALVRVLQGLHSERPANFEELAEQKERYLISFPLGPAASRKIVERVGFYSASEFSKPKFMRQQHNVRGEFLGWHIVDTDTLHRQLVKTLTVEQKELSP
ncbi:hypothetical protein [Sphingobacterium sp. LRF_L2]|uniref:hypothetical protein n=1 Tax=Sphingobacterium sp. LRF_L2 TaxID=3369421 RepID=UPI003F636423